jgi:hypothetical protein
MNVAEKSDLPSLTEGTQAENGPKIRGKAEPSGGPAPPASSNEATADAPPQTKEDPQAPTKRAEDVAPGGCMPFGITVQGELVFPMLCQELLARNLAQAAGPHEVKERLVIGAHGLIKRRSLIVL